MAKLGVAWYTQRIVKAKQCAIKLSIGIALLGEVVSCTVREKLCAVPLRNAVETQCIQKLRDSIAIHVLELLWKSHANSSKE